MNAPHNTYGGNVIQLGRVIATARAEHERITAANYSRGPQYVPEAPMVVDALEEDYGPTVAPRFMRRDVDDVSTGVIWAVLAGCFAAMCLAVAILPTNF